jgi:hypothetical protein
MSETVWFTCTGSAPLHPIRYCRRMAVQLRIPAPLPRETGGLVFAGRFDC